MVEIGLKTYFLEVNPFDMFNDLFGMVDLTNLHVLEEVKTFSLNLNITLEESYFSKEKTVKFNRVTTNNKMCGTCKGSGMVQQMVQSGPFRQMLNSVCPNCNGNGFEGGGFRKREEVKFKIPRALTMDYL